MPRTKTLGSISAKVEKVQLLSWIEFAKAEAHLVPIECLHIWETVAFSDVECARLMIKIAQRIPTDTPGALLVRSGGHRLAFDYHIQRLS